MKKDRLVKDGIFHVFNKSIANYEIFRSYKNSTRFINTLDYYNNSIIVKSFSKSLRDKSYIYQNFLYLRENQLVKCICYCIMPDHYHLIIKILKDNTLSKYMNDVENSYTRYFNLKFDRKGPLWQSDFRAVRIKTNEQMLHVTRYIHLNPTTSRLLDKSEDWQPSSYRDYIEDKNILKNIMIEVSIKNPLTYKRFVEDQIDYQRKLKIIKKMIFD